MLCLSSSAKAEWWWPFGYDGVDYKIEINGIDDEMRAWIKQLKLDEKTETNPPQNIEELKQESVSLSDKIRKALEAKGYYDVLIEQSTEETSSTLHYDVTQGERYIVSSVQIKGPDDIVKSASTDKLLTKEGLPADADALQQDTKTLTTIIGKDSCLLSLKVASNFQLHGKTHKADATFTVTSGPPAGFGKTRISGNENVHDAVILRAVSWKEDQCFDRTKLEKTQSDLIQNQLFSSVTVKAADEPDEDGTVPVTISVKERVPRTVKAGVNYSTDDGAGISTSWQHRNLWGDAQDLTISNKLAQMEQSLRGNLRIPNFRRDDQTLSFLSSIKHENIDNAYNSTSFENSANIERKLSDHLNGGTGIGFTLTKTDDPLAGNESYGLLSLPTFLQYSTRDSSSDPTKGVFGRVNVTPYTETFGDGGQFIKSQATGQAYWTASKTRYKPTLAARLSVGTITGSNLSSVPSDLRFYAGGGGSVRGYGYKSIGPQVNGENVGGSSLIEGSTELRLRFTEEFGGVAFVDAGNAYSGEIHEADSKLFYGAGLGVRYYSPLGPLRLDVAVPLNGKDIGEEGFAVYVSLGQAF